MSEEAKEKAGGGKGAHRKKKGKKVREGALFVSVCASFCSAEAQQKVFFSVTVLKVRGCRLRCD